MWREDPREKEVLDLSDLPEVVWSTLNFREKPMETEDFKLLWVHDIKMSPLSLKIFSKFYITY